MPFLQLQSMTLFLVNSNTYEPIFQYFITLKFSAKICVHFSLRNRKNFYCSARVNANYVSDSLDEKKI